MTQSNDGRSTKATEPYPTPTSFSRFAVLESLCHSCGDKSAISLGWASSDSSQSGSLPSPQADSPESSATDLSSSSPSQQSSPSSGSGSLSSSNGSGPSTTESSMKREDKNHSASYGKKRCNSCSRLMSKRTLRNNRCLCGSRAWFFSRVTIFERVSFWFGIDKDDQPETLRVSRDPIAGHTSVLAKAWNNPKEVSDG